MKIFGYSVEECLTFFMLVVIGYFIAKMFSQKCNGFSVGAEIDCSTENPIWCKSPMNPVCKWEKGKCVNRPPPKNYTCRDLQCVEDPNGNYKSEEECNDSDCMAGVRNNGEYYCGGGECISHSTHNGEYKDKTECENFCGKKDPGDICDNRGGECKGDYNTHSELCIRYGNDFRCVECVSKIGAIKLKDPNDYCIANGKKNHTCVNNECKLMNGYDCSSDLDCKSGYCNNLKKCEGCLSDKLKPPNCDTCKDGRLEPPNCNKCKDGSRLEPPKCEECSINNKLEPPNCRSCKNPLHKMPDCNKCKEDYLIYPDCGKNCPEVPGQARDISNCVKNCEELNLTNCHQNVLCESKNNQCQSIIKKRLGDSCKKNSECQTGVCHSKDLMEPDKCMNCSDVNIATCALIPALDGHNDVCKVTGKGLNKKCVPR